MPHTGDRMVHQLLGGRGDGARVTAEDVKPWALRLREALRRGLAGGRVTKTYAL